ncbi:MAG: molybdopterin molybdotransferase MoeA [Candidatus Bathyarchaeia archaeon]
MSLLVRLKGFQKLVTIEEARQKFFNNLKIERRTVVVPLAEALNRVLAEDIVADEDLPRFDRSAVDGYAVRAEDTFGASQFKPKRFRLTHADEVKVGEAKQVWTGTPLPKGANAVLMLEHTKRVSDNEIEVLVAVAPGENVSKRGEDVAKGEVAVKAGTRLKPHHLGLIAALGKNQVRVYEKPKVAVLATGNELVEIGKTLGENQVYEVNRLVIASLCRELGAEPVDLGIARDDIEEIFGKIRLGLEKADVVVTTGGTSVGASDLVPAVINSIGKPGVVVHGVAMRPAMPTALAVINNKPVIVLSGNPVAAMFGFEVFAGPLILKMLGAEHESRPVLKAKLTRRISTALGRKTFVRVRVFQCNGEFYAEPISARGSGVLSTMTKANGYVVVPENREGLEEGETVLVHLFDAVEATGEHV